MKIDVTDDEIARIENWAIKGLEEGSHYSGMSYEDGIIDTLMWLRGDTEYAPDKDE